MTTLGLLVQGLTQQPKHLLAVPVRKSSRDVVIWLAMVRLFPCLTARTKLMFLRTNTQWPSASCLRIRRLWQAFHPEICSNSPSTSSYGGQTSYVREMWKGEIISIVLRPALLTRCSHLATRALLLGIDEYTLESDPINVLTRIAKRPSLVVRRSLVIRAITVARWSKLKRILRLHSLAHRLRHEIQLHRLPTEHCPPLRAKSFRRSQTCKDLGLTMATQVRLPHSRRT